MSPSYVVTETVAFPRVVAAVAAARPLKTAPSAVSAAAAAAFAASPYLALRRVICRVERDALVLNGRLPTYYLKQVALATAKKIAGVRRIVDRLEIRPAESSGS